MNHPVYLDKVGYEVVGYFGDWKLYRPKGVIAGGEWWSESFSCNSSQLVINGGGYFEPEVIVVPDPERIVAEYLVMWGLIEFKEGSPQWLSYKNFFDKDLYPRIKNILERKGPLFYYPAWQPENFYELIEASKIDTKFSRPLQKGDLVEHWLCGSLGEFIWFDYPDIADGFISELRAKVKYINSKIWRNVRK